MPTTPATASLLSDDAAEWLRKGQSLESRGTASALTEAIACYDSAIALLQNVSNPTSDSSRRLAIAWMNRGNALQQHADPVQIHSAVQAYDRAIALLKNLNEQNAPGCTNSLGAAWLNRGHALQQLSEATHRDEAIRSLEQAITILDRPSIESQLDQRLNLSGAHLNLAHLVLASTEENRYERAHAAAAAALNLSVDHELTRSGFVEIGLKARRVLCELIGQWLIQSPDPQHQQQLIATASDAVDTGLTLARRWDSLNVPQFRPLAERLFRFGTAFYRRHQPQFLADFVLESCDRDHTSDAFLNFPAIHTIGRESLMATREDLRTQHPVIVNDPTSDRHFDTLVSIDSALQKLDGIQHSSDSSEADSS